MAHFKSSLLFLLGLVFTVTLLASISGQVSAARDIAAEPVGVEPQFSQKLSTDHTGVRKFIYGGGYGGYGGYGGGVGYIPQYGYPYGGEFGGYGGYPYGGYGGFGGGYFPPRRT